MHHLKQFILSSSHHPMDKGGKVTVLIHGNLQIP